MLELNKIYNEDCLEGMKQIEDNSVDLIVTDPPYGYSFMGKDWDKAVPSVEIWKQCLRVLKPGAFAFVMSAPRQDVQSQMVIRLSEAGFVTSFTPLYHAFASGFPKSANISKLVNKKLGAEREVVGEKIAPDGIPYSKRMKEEHGPSYDDSTYGDYDNNPMETASTTPQAKALDGAYTFNPKPAVEIILVAQKPLKHKTFVGQAMNWVTQRLNILKEIELELKKQGVENIEWSKD